MPKNKRKFIDKKNAVTFYVVHRSQQDPLIADEKAPQHVLLHGSQQPKQRKLKKVKEEELKYGIYFDDDYDYLQHLRDVTSSETQWEQADAPTKHKEKAKMQLPSSVFASEVEEDVGLLNKAAPQSGLRLDLDPDIVAAMDEDFDYSDPENQLEDNFVELAIGDRGLEFGSDVEVDEGEEEEYSDEMDGGSELSDSNLSELHDDVASLDREETKSRFTEYSMTSSVIRRNEQLTLLDDRFEEMFAEYEDNEIGALDCEEIEGELDPSSDRVLQLAKELEDEKPKKPDVESTALFLSESESSENEEEILMPIKEKEKWDCESILSTYSNLYNHPKLISEPPTNKIKVSGKTGMPVINNRLTAKALKELGGTNSVGSESIVSQISQLSIRNKDETPDEKKKRKQALKQYRKERREERKVNTLAFKDEKKRMEKAMINNKISSQVAVHF